MLAFCLIGMASHVHAQSTVEEPEESRAEPTFEWTLLPNTETNTDRGIGAGLIGQFYWYEPGLEPFRDRLTISTILTNRLYQDHFVSWDRLGLLGSRLRINVTAGFLAIADQSYCGTGNAVQCDVETAQDEARNAGLTAGTTAFDDFVRDYYWVRAMRPYATAIARWKPQRQRQWFELYASWRGIVELSGFFGDRGPYPGSLFARDSDSAEREFHQALEFGVLVDQRNNETRPTSGWLVGAFTRNALLLGGGAKTYSAATLTLADYRRLGTSLGLSNWVLANRVVLDVMTGDVPVRELSRVGGLWRTTAFGGTIGRGIRADRFSGKFKLVSQTELRTGGVPLFGSVKLGAQLFADVGWVGKTLTNFGGRPTQLRSGFGLGPSLLWGRSFVARLEVGFSRAEDFQPFFYVRLGHPF